MSAPMELTNDILKSILADAMVFRGMVRVPLEEVTQPGRYIMDASTPESELTKFSGSGSIPRLAHLEVMYRGEADLIQRVTETNNGVPNVVMRVCRLGTWKPWYRVAVTPLS